MIRCPLSVAPLLLFLATTASMPCSVAVAQIVVHRPQVPDPEPAGPLGEWPGRQADGSVRLPSGWSVNAHGEQITLASDLPVRAVRNPQWNWLAVQHAGYRDHGVGFVALDTEPGSGAATLGGFSKLPKTWSGLAWRPDGGRLYVSGGVDDVVHVLDFDPDAGTAELVKSLPVGDPSRLDLVAGLAFAPGGNLFVCLQRSQQVVCIDADDGEQEFSIGLADGSFPNECLIVERPEDATGFARELASDFLVVSGWGAGKVWFFDARTGKALAQVPTGQHPSSLLFAPLTRRLFVSNANENSVSVIDLETLLPSETLSSALYPGVPPGSTPDALALDGRENLLLVANADNNNCAVLDVSEPGEARGLGYIPLGLYPTALLFADGDQEVFAVNGKGSVGSRANPEGPQPIRGHVRRYEDYAGALFTGSLSRFRFPEPRELQALSQQAYACSPLRADLAVRGVDARPADSPIPAEVGGESPIRHCVYVIKENRTYDQVFGDVERGNGDPLLCLFGEDVTPNHHAWVDRFVLLDSFYVESEVSADGHEWTMGAYATDFVERTWPVTYGGKGQGLGYPAEANFEIAFPKGRYLFDLAANAGVSFRSYGEFIQNGATPADPGTAKMPVLEGRFDPGYRGYDLAYRDVDRAARFLEELARFEAEGEFPRLTVLRLPNDHTSGTVVGKLTPRAMVADNDLALGRVLEGLSKSSFWKSMVVFVVEDDAQNGPDHVDAHRTVGLVAGPYVKQGGEVVSTMYSTCSMLRTMELILGLPPMSQFDAAARPMYDCFTATPDLTPFEALPATWDLDERNPKTAWGAEMSERFDLSREDAADDLLLNEVVWRSVKGADSPMPRPVRAAFVRVVGED